MPLARSGLGSPAEQVGAQSFNLLLHRHFNLRQGGIGMGRVPGGKLTLRLIERIGLVRRHGSGLSC